MPSGAIPDADTDPAARPADLRHAGTWLARHGLADAKPTPLLATRLAARQRARLADAVLLTVLLIAAALTQVNYVLTDAASAVGALEPDRRTPLLIMTALVAGLLLAQWLLDWWVRRVDRRAGATLARRAAHPLQLGWRAVLGRPFAAFTVATFTGATVLAASALTVRDATVRYAAVILLIGLLGVGLGRVVQLHHLLTRPVVAEDEASLTADVIMRIEDARELTTPSGMWLLPLVLLFGFAPGWWNAASLIFVVVSLAALVMVHARSPQCVTVARRVMSASAGASAR